MDRLSMCRICLAENLSLREVVGTYLQEMYQSLTNVPLDTKDFRPIGICYICWARLKNCYQLKNDSLQSEHLFAQMLSNNVRSPLQLGVAVSTRRLSVKHITLLSMGHVAQFDVDRKFKLEPPEVFDNIEVKSEHEGSPPVATKPRLVPHEHHDDIYISSNKLRRSDINKAKSEQPKSEPNSTVEYKPDKGSKLVEACDKVETVHKAAIENNRQHKIKKHSYKKLKSYICDTCQKCFSTERKLVIHVSTHTGEKPFKCNVCKKCFKQKPHLNRHSRTHTGEKPYVCGVCKKCFSRKGILDRHIRTHSGEKPYKCNVCKKCFRAKCTLKKHIRIHTGEKPYMCNVCQKCYSQKGDLDLHIRTHTGEKPYMCNECKKCFIRKDVLYLHIRTHTGEKPFMCNVCKKYFSRKDVLDSHFRTHTVVNSYICDVCNSGFNDKRNLLKHIRAHSSS